MASQLVEEIGNHVCLNCSQIQGSIIPNKLNAHIVNLEILTSKLFLILTQSIFNPITENLNVNVKIVSVNKICQIEIMNIIVIATVSDRLKKKLTVLVPLLIKKHLNLIKFIQNYICMRK